MLNLLFSPLVRSGQTFLSEICVLIQALITGGYGQLPADLAFQLAEKRIVNIGDTMS